MTSKHLACAACTIGLLWTMPAQGTDDEQLRFNPFAPTGAGAPKAKADPLEPTPPQERVAAAPKLAAPPFNHTLRAVLKNSKGGVVNVDGVIVTLGDSFNGYRLVKVSERSAIFAHGSSRATLTLP